MFQIALKYCIFIWNESINMKKANIPTKFQTVVTDMKVETGCKRVGREGFHCNMGMSQRLKASMLRTCLVVQWLGLHVSTAGGKGSIPGWGIKILHATEWPIKKKKRDTSCV